LKLELQSHRTTECINTANVIQCRTIDHITAGHDELSALECFLQTSLFFLVLRGQYPHPDPGVSAHCGLYLPDNSGRKGRSLVRVSSATLHASSLALTLTDCSVLQNITVGRLRIITNERIYEFPERVTGSAKGNEPHAELRVINDAFWVRLCMMGDLGFAEAYMFGDVICEDLIPIFLVRILNSSLLLIPAD
jgi:hypothetical protein